jgi:methionine synthase I (cobalamin-dependent)
VKFSGQARFVTEVATGSTGRREADPEWPEFAMMDEPDLLSRLLAERDCLLADGATGTNLFDLGLVSGEAPEIWLIEQPDRIRALHRSFVEAGADIILTNSFGANRFRLKLHGLELRALELNATAAGLAREFADAAGRPVVVAGSIGPTGELFEPLGALTFEGAVAAFREQAEGLMAGGADVAWIETMSAGDEIVAAAEGAAQAGLPFIFTASFDTAGRTMMGLPPDGLPALAGRLARQPIALGANCGLGPSDLVASVLAISAVAPEAIVIAKGNCGVPQFVDGEVRYVGSPAMMADYARLARAAGARIIGGCCGTRPEHIAAMRAALDEPRLGRPDLALVESALGPVARPKCKDVRAGPETRRRRAAQS